MMEEGKRLLPRRNLWLMDSCYCKVNTVLLFLLSLHKITNREQVEEEEEEKETHIEQTSQVKTERNSSDSENEGTKDVKGDDDDRLFKDKTIDSIRSKIMEEAVQLGTFSGYSF